MVPQNQFDRMALLALVAIILLLTFACRAYAAEIDFQDSGPLFELGEGEELGGAPGTGTLLGEVTQIRQMMELVLYFAIPFFCAGWLVYKFLMWFYYTFIRTVL